MDHLWRPVALLGVTLVAALAVGCGVQGGFEEPETVFAEAAPALEMELPADALGVIADTPGGFLAGELSPLSREEAWGLLWSDPVLRGHLKGAQVRADQLRRGLNTIWARYPGGPVGLFWGDASQAAWPLGEAVGLRTILHVHTSGLGPAALPLRLQAPGLTPAPATAGGLIIGVVVARDVLPTLGQVDAAVWAPAASQDRRLPSWSWGGLQRLSDDATGLDLVLCDIGLVVDARERIRWGGAALDMDDHLSGLDEVPLERDADVRASWKYALQEGILRAWQRGEFTWETPVTGTILAGLDGDDQSLVVVGPRSVEVVDAETGVLAARFLRGWEDVPGLADALAGLDAERGDQDAHAFVPLAGILSAAWESEAALAAARGWAPAAAWWDGWAVFFGSLPF
ncbi:MAG: hypothetical protein ABIK09_18775 [Pseudomonadota bacterium]